MEWPIGLSALFSSRSPRTMIIERRKLTFSTNTVVFMWQDDARSTIGVKHVSRRQVSTLQTINREKQAGNLRPVGCETLGCFPLCQRFRKFWLEFKSKSPFQFLLTGIFGITSGGGPLISVGIFRPKFVVPYLTNRFFALIREFGRETNSCKSHSYWLARFHRKMSLHFTRKFLLISDRSVWHNGKHPSETLHHVLGQPLTTILDFILL